MIYEPFGMFSVETLTLPVEAILKCASPRNHRSTVLILGLIHKLATLSSPRRPSFHEVWSFQFPLSCLLRRPCNSLMACSCLNSDFELSGHVLACRSFDILPIFVYLYLSVLGS